MIAVGIYVAVPLLRHEDYGQRVLWLTLLALLVLIGVSAFYAWSGGWTSGEVKLYIVGLIGVSLWIWIQRGAPAIVWVIIATVLACGIWLAIVIIEPGVPTVFTERTPLETLLERDKVLLEAIYEATNGRRGIHFWPHQLVENTSLTHDQVEVAGARLVDSQCLEWDDSLGYALLRRGIDAVEREHLSTRMGSRSVNNTFNFHGNTSGVFGSHNSVRGNTFTSAGIPDGKADDLLRFAQAAVGWLPSAEGRELTALATELAHQQQPSSKARASLRRISEIAKVAGEAGVPLVRLVDELMRAFAS